MQSHQLDQLFETFFDITSLTRMERGDATLYSRVLDCCRDLLRADNVMLLRVRDQRLERYSKRGSGAALYRDELPGTDVLIDWLDREAKPFVGPAGEWKRPLEAPLFERSAASLLCVPLIAKETQIGLLVALRERALEPFGVEDLRIITVLANQTAIALENADLYRRLRREAVTDGLTGILNYRSFMRTLRAEVRRARRYQHEFAFIMADVDHLKVYNERFGHLAGSQVLAQVAHELVENCRATDIVGKYGGDEFALILPSTDASGAQALSERMRLAIERHRFKHVEPGEVTCSFGISVYPTDAEDVYGLIRQADAVLFAAKRSGKNTVRTTEDVQLPVSRQDEIPADEFLDPTTADRTTDDHTTGRRKRSPYATRS